MALAEVAPNEIIRRQYNSCEKSHQDISYRRTDQSILGGIHRSGYFCLVKLTSGRRCQRDAWDFLKRLQLEYTDYIAWRKQYSPISCNQHERLRNQVQVRQPLRMQALAPRWYHMCY